MSGVKKTVMWSSTLYTVKEVSRWIKNLETTPNIGKPQRIRIPLNIGKPERILK